MTFKVESLSYDFSTGMATAILTKPAGGTVTVPSTVQITFSLATQVPPLPPTTPASAFAADIKDGARKVLVGEIMPALQTI
jgi:beta-lactam-binding protein with PASTA domain